MRRLVSGLLMLLLGVSAVEAANPTFAQSPQITIGPNGVVIGRESRDGDRNRDRDRDRPRRDRYVCVVPPPPSANRDRPYVCNASEGRVGGRCRCSGVVGSGRLDIDR